jgi:nucleotide-binding universal stress UspA family protein
MSTGHVREVLVATDFSDVSEVAVRVAHGYARAFGARLHILHVAWPDEHGLKELFGRLLADLGTAVALVVASQRGQAADEIVQYARLHGIDLIVLGTHGRTGVGHALLGSVAERVIRSAPCPVLTVPAAWGGRSGEARVLPPAVQPCLVCQTLSRALVCEPCRQRIRGQATYSASGGQGAAHGRRPS